MKLPKEVHILGVILAFLVGVAGIIMGITQKTPKFVVFGITTVVAAAVATFAGGIAQPRGSVSPPGFGAKFGNLPDIATVIIIILYVIALVLGFTVFK